MLTTVKTFDFSKIGTRLLISIFKLLGLAPYNLPINLSKSKLSNKNSWQNLPRIQFSPSRAGCVYNLCLVSLQILMLFIAIPVAYDVDFIKLSLLAITMQIAACVFGNFALFTIWFIIAFRQKSAVNLLNDLLSLESAIVSINRNARMESIFWFIFVVFFANIVIWTGLLLTQKLAYDSPVVTCFLVIVPSLIVSEFVIVYIFLMKLIEKQFKAMNKVLSDVFENRLFVTIEEVDYRFSSRITRIRRFHSNLYEISSKISDWWSLPIFVSIAYNFYMILNSSYYFIVPFVIFGKNEQTHLGFGNSIFWLTSETMPIAILATGVNDITAQMRITSDIVRNLFNRPNISRSDRNELKLFAMELMHRKLEFTACGFFKLDRTLLHSIISIVATYLIILLQLKMASPDKFAW